MILGDKCTRACGFCSIDDGVPAQVDPLEAENIAITVAELGLKHVVVTSVTRDDLPGGGAAQFALTIRAIRDTLSDIFIEVLISDFNGDFTALETVTKARPDILNHNLETVASLYSLVRPQADYERSLEILSRAASAGLIVKTGIMVGLGEAPSEVRALLKEVALTGCSIITIGQYLRPSKDNFEVVEYIEPAIFEEYGAYAKEAGIDYAYSGPLVRSSYNAEEVWKNFTG